MIINDFIKSLGQLAEETITKLIITKLITLIPFLAWGPFKYLLNWYLQKRIKQLIDLGEYGVIDFFISSAISSQKSALENAINEHNKIKELGNINEILVSEENLKNKLREFIKLNR